MWGMKVISSGDAHVVPMGDYRKHKKSRRCWCDPRFEDENRNPVWDDHIGKTVVIHRPLDGRSPSGLG